jgi:hypothetical protein
MSTKTILAIFLTASLAGNASFLITTFLKRPPQQIGAIDQLSLTAEQASKFEGTRRIFQDQRVQAHKRMAELRGVLADEFLKETPDRQRLVNTAVEMAQVQTDMRPRLIDHLLVLHELLSSTQRTNLAEIMRASEAACPGAALYSEPGKER